MFIPWLFIVYLMAPSLFIDNIEYTSRRGERDAYYLLPTYGVASVWTQIYFLTAIAWGNFTYFDTD